MTSSGPTPGEPPPRPPRIVRLARITDPIPGLDVEPSTARDGDPLVGAAADAALDERWMRAALEEARTAAALGEVPVGAVVVRGSAIVARAHNLRETTADPTAHAEVLALREAARRTGSWRLDGMTLVVTLEPCPMCAGALVNARLDRLVYGAADPKAGAVGSLMDLARDPRLNHRLEVRAGALAAECADVLRTFFAARRPPRAGAPRDARTTPAEGAAFLDAADGEP